MTETRSIAICVATCGRPELLRGLVKSLKRMDVPTGYLLELRLVNNLPQEPIPAAVLGELETFPGRIHVANESERNIATVRNRAVNLGPADLVAFVDDDETVASDWLRELVDTRERLDAAAVFGPVERLLPPDAPRWLQRSGFLKDGPREVEMSWERARTGNALVDGAWFYEHGLRFDSDFGRSGGEDAHLFGRIQALGGRLVSAPSAWVQEVCPPERARFGWLWWRAWNCGEIYERLCRVFPSRRPPVARFLGRLGRSALFAALGLGPLLVGRPEAFLGSLLGIALAIGGAREWLRPRNVNSLPTYGT